MRRQSPSSSGLLPASYSRRRRNRPNESLVGIAGENYVGANINQNQQSSTYNSYYRDSNDTYEDVGSVSSGNNDNNNFGLRTRGSPTRQTYTEIDAQQNSYDDYDSEDENDENYNRNNSHYNNNDVYEQGYEDVLDKPLKLSDFLINDRCYHRYLLEGKRSSYRGIINGVKASTDDNKGFMDPIFLAKVSTICSFIGMLFLLFVAIIIETQPLYIKGVKVYSSNQNNEQDIEYRFRKETSNALKASAAYFLTMVLSIIYIQAPSLELNPAMGRICHLKRLVVSTYFRYRRRHYDAIPDNNGSIFGGGSSSTSGSILPTHSSSANGSEGDKLLKSRRRKKRSSKRKNPDDKHDDDDHGGKGGGVLGKIKSWGIMGGGSSQTVRKKDR